MNHVHITLQNGVPVGHPNGLWHSFKSEINHGSKGAIRIDWNLNTSPTRFMELLFANKVICWSKRKMEENMKYLPSEDCMIEWLKQSCTLMIVECTFINFVVTELIVNSDIITNV